MRDNAIREFIEQLGHEIPGDVKKQTLSLFSTGIEDEDDGIDKSTEAVRDMKAFAFISSA